MGPRQGIRARSIAWALFSILVTGCSGSDIDGNEAAVGSKDAAAGKEHEGKGTYDRACFSCHQTGLVGAPRFGDEAAWTPRIAKGMDVLVIHAIEGFSGDAGVMPAKGGHRYLSDAKVEAAVRYMVAAVRSPPTDQ